MTQTWNIKCSRTLSVPINRSSCCTYADNAIILLTFAVLPFSFTTPFTSTFDRFLWVNTFISVVFPAPLNYYILKFRFGKFANVLKHLIICIKYLNRNKTNIFQILWLKIMKIKYKISWFCMTWNSWVLLLKNFKLILR